RPGRQGGAAQLGAVRQDDGLHPRRHRRGQTERQQDGAGAIASAEMSLAGPRTSGPLIKRRSGMEDAPLERRAPSKEPDHERTGGPRSRKRMSLAGPRTSGPLIKRRSGMEDAPLVRRDPRKEPDHERTG